MLKRKSIIPGKRVNYESGQALILVLVLLLLGSFIIVPLMAYMATGLRTTSQVFEPKVDAQYAADAGIEDAVWQIKYEHLDTLFPDYSPYDYTTDWTYPLSEQVNAKSTSVSINNVWIPKDVAIPGESQARNIIEAGKLIVTGSISATSTYQIKISYYKGSAEDLRVTSLGVWLPRGFEYVMGSSDFEVQGTSYYSVPAVSPHAGGQAVIWTFSSYPFVGYDANHDGDYNDVGDYRPFPGVAATRLPMESTITFRFTSSQAGQNPSAIGWITTSGVIDIPFSWDADTRIYRILSTSDSTQVEAYIAKNELRQLGSAIEGDYRAAGGSLMIDTNHDTYGIRDQLLASSDAVVSDIPTDAEVEAAYLYWSAWKAETSKQTVFSDDCQGFGNWISGSTWNINSGRFRSHYSSGAESTRYLTLKSSLNLSSYVPGSVTVSWEQSEGGTLEADDGLDFAFSADGGTTWSSDIQAFRDDNPSLSFIYTIPAQYLTASFKIRYHLASMSGSGEYCYIDNIKIIAAVPDTAVVFKINGQQVYFDAGGVPRKGSQEVTAGNMQILPNYDESGAPNGFSYAGYKDVTALVRAFTQSPTTPPTNYPGNATYTVGGVSGNTGNQWSYAGWSLVIIYSSPETRGHQLYLYDNFIYAHNDTNIDFDQNGQPGGDISGFLVPRPIGGEVNAARLTCFVGEGDACWTGDQLKFNGTALSNDKSPSNNVWNSKSPGLNADGVDIDTFDITWASNLLKPMDTSAHIDLPTQDDSWNLVYIIISFRSDTKTGGAISYLIRG